MEFRLAYPAHIYISVTAETPDQAKQIFQDELQATVDNELSGVELRQIEGDSITNVMVYPNTHPGTGRIRAVDIVVEDIPEKGRANENGG